MEELYKLSGRMRENYVILQRVNCTVIKQSALHIMHYRVLTGSKLTHADESNFIFPEVRKLGRNIFLRVMEMDSLISSVFL